MTDTPAEDQLRTHTRAALEAAGLSQAEVSRQLGVSTKHLSQMLTGRAPLTLTWAEGILGLAGHSLVIGTRPDDEELGAGPPASVATEAHTGLVIDRYRTDRGEIAWCFRCWGTDTCDGWLSLDHYSQQSAERARDRHVREDHQAEPPAPDAGPTVAECRDHDRAHWNDKYDRA